MEDHPIALDELRQVSQLIFERYGHDFRDYSAASLKRRLHYACGQLGFDSLAALQERLLASPEGFAQLLQYLTVPVSEMFRDPSYFLALRRHVVPLLRTYASLKVWVAGCSTGEEAYSLAILLHEEGLLPRTLLYATDINQQSLEKARQGIFPLERLQGFTSNYQHAGGQASFADYYTAAYGGALFDKSLRAAITFADHSLATDHVFAEVQLVSCRNVLIYFNRVLQDRALGLFHDALSRRGFLGLGSKESLDFSAYAQHFEAVSKPDRIFRKMAPLLP